MSPIPPTDPAVLRPRSCLVLGGARSGKSAFAQALAEQSDRAPVYLATATAWDDEMRERVSLHQGMRDARWRTIESPIELVATLERAVDPDVALVVDCLTLWLTNLMLGGHDVSAHARGLVAAVARFRGPVVFVSNEVGSGIVPDNPLGRQFRDVQGRLNQDMAAACETVLLVVAGLPVLLKPATLPRISL